MKIRTISLLFTLAILSLTIAIGYAPISAQPVAPANRSIYVFGDSWAQRMSEEGTPIPLEQALIDREFDDFVTLHKHGISGSTMEQWATDNNGTLTALAAAITLDPNPNPIVFFTLGGNDVRASATAPQIAANLGIILTALEQTRADLKIVYGSYDILNPNVQPLCSIGLQQIFGTTDPTEVNTVFYTFHQGAVAVTSMFPRTELVNTFGSMQGTPGNPDLSNWSPVQYINPDCLHPNSAGFTLYLNTLFTDQLTPALCTDTMVTASACLPDKLVFLPIIVK